MPLLATLSSPEALVTFRERYRAEMHCQIIHDSIHRRRGWTRSYELNRDGNAAGFATVAVGGPWTDKPTVLEYYVVPEHRSHVFILFESLLAASGARFIETQTNGTMLAHLLHLWSADATSERILFEDKFTTTLSANGAKLRRVTTDEETRVRFEQRDGASDWNLELGGTVIGHGSVLFHYNAPFGDIAMDVAESHRRRGYGAYLVQEMKRVCRELGGIPGARCNPSNVGSRQTLVKAGFVPCGHILVGSIKPVNPG